MKHRPQGSLGDSSCQDWREERGNVHTHKEVSEQGHATGECMVKLWISRLGVRLISRWFKYTPASSPLINQPNGAKLNGTHR